MSRLHFIRKIELWVEFVNDCGMAIVSLPCPPGGKLRSQYIVFLFSDFVDASGWNARKYRGSETIEWRCETENMTLSYRIQK